MRQDLGALDGPVLLFGGPYSNLQATQALLAEADVRGISNSNMICTGDVVAYCGDPLGTTALLRDRRIATVAGNCEQQLAAGSDTCGCGFEEGSTCDVLSAGWYAYASGQVTPADRAWMAACPDVITFTHQGARYAVLHGGMTEVARFIWSTSEDTVFDKEWQAIEQKIGSVDHVIAGHSGIPFIRSVQRGTWINAGVIGMPPHDGTQQTRFAILDGGEVLIHRLRYDVDAAVARMIDAGLTQGYDKGLVQGYWPSEDVLPQSLRVPSLASG